MAQLLGWLLQPWLSKSQVVRWWLRLEEQNVGTAGQERMTGYSIDLWAVLGSQQCWDVGGLVAAVVVVVVLVDAVV